MKKTTKYRAPADPLTGKRKPGRPSNEERAALAQASGNPPPVPPSRPRKPRPTPKPTTASSSSTDEDALRRALAELEPGEQGGGEGQAAAEGSTDAPRADEPPTLLSPGDLVDVAETITALGIAGYALFTRREIPDEDRLKLSNGARKLCGITAQGTLDAAGPVLQENAWIARAVSPIGFGASLLLHVFQRVGEVQRQPQRAQKRPAKPVQHETVQPPAPTGPSTAPPPIPTSATSAEGRVLLPSIPEPLT